MLLLHRHGLRAYAQRCPHAVIHHSDHGSDYYLDEFTFGVNRRSSRSGGLLFYRLRLR